MRARACCFAHCPGRADAVWIRCAATGNWPRELGAAARVRGAFPFPMCFLSTDAHLCHACSCRHEIEDENTGTGEARASAPRRVERPPAGCARFEKCCSSSPAAQTLVAALGDLVWRACVCDVCLAGCELAGLIFYGTTQEETSSSTVWYNARRNARKFNVFLCRTTTVQD
eukprot:COSAG01_NODE_1820_length_9152_cov_22.869215_3_plen_171_part_00